MKYSLDALLLEMANKTIDDIKDYCLIQVFKYLDTDDWMNLCWTTKRFREIVKSHIVGRREIVTSSERVFALFGKVMTKVSYTGELDKFLSMLLKHCTPGLLTEIHLGRDNSEDRQIDQDLVARTAKYLEHVNTLCCCDMEMTSEWLAFIPTHQILTLNLQLKGTYDLRLNPDSFPNLRRCAIMFCFPMPKEYPMETITGIKDFIRRKSNLTEFYYRYFLDTTMFTTVAEDCSNITSLGYIYFAETLDWNWRRFQHLETIAFDIDVEVFTGHQEFTNIFIIVSSLKTLKVLMIAFKNNFKTENVTVCNEIVSILKSDHRKIEHLKYLDLIIGSKIVGALGQLLCHMIATTFNVKILSLTLLESQTDLKCVNSIVRNVDNLEHLIIAHRYPMETQVKFWSKLMKKKITSNNQLKILKNLIIYVDTKCEDKMRSELGSIYDPQIIAIEPHSKFPREFTLPLCHYFALIYYAL